MPSAKNNSCWYSINVLSFYFVAQATYSHTANKGLLAHNIHYWYMTQ